MAYNILLPEHNIHKKTHLPKSVIHSLSLFSPKWATCIHTMRRYTFYCFFYFDKRQKVDCLMNQHHKILSPFSIQEQLHRWLWHNHLDRLCHCINEGRKHVSQASRQKYHLYAKDTICQQWNGQLAYTAILLADQDSWASGDFLLL